MQADKRTSYQSAGGISFVLERKRVKNVNLRVRRDGTVYVSAPKHEPLERIRGLVEEKRPWIERRQALQAERRSLLPVSWDSGETLQVWGKPCELVLEQAKSARQEHVECADGLVLLYVSPRWREEPPFSEAVEHREKLVRSWQADEVRHLAEPLLERYAQQLQVQPSKLRTRTMSSRWGSCNVKTGAITLNTRLAEYEPICLESVVVHELCHLIERGHNARFYAEMDHVFPAWREAHELLR